MFWSLREFVVSAKEEGVALEVQTEAVMKSTRIEMMDEASKKSVSTIS